MKENPINEILRTSLENIGAITNTNKIVGEPISLPNNAVAIPISKVVCGYGVGGSELPSNNKKVEVASEIFPFGGASGGGLTITPTALIILQENKIKILNVEKKNDLLNKLADAFKEMLKK